MDRRQERQPRAAAPGGDQLGRAVRRRGERAGRPTMVSVGTPGPRQPRIPGGDEQQTLPAARRAHLPGEPGAVGRGAVAEHHASAPRQRRQRRP